MRDDEDLKRLLKAACPPVVAPPQFKKQLLTRLMCEVARAKSKEGK